MELKLVSGAEAMTMFCAWADEFWSPYHMQARLELSITLCAIPPVLLMYEIRKHDDCGVTSAAQNLQPLYTRYDKAWRDGGKQAISRRVSIVRSSVATKRKPQEICALNDQHQDMETLEVIIASCKFRWKVHNSSHLPSRPRLSCPSHDPDISFAKRVCSRCRLPWDLGNDMDLYPSRVWSGASKVLTTTTVSFAENTRDDVIRSTLKVNAQVLFLCVSAEVGRAAACLSGNSTPNGDRDCVPARQAI